jgi:hypothetical protein
VIKVFESFDLSYVGQLASLLEAHGIRTFLKNEFSAGALGELPFVEICPQLYILKERDLAKARSLIDERASPDHTFGDWTCLECGASVEANFGQCWQCGSCRVDPRIPFA